ncbi:hypothetical protein DENSPDRAFT_896397 [Dentipellis sp. KUC8613]|nr:hypothetical protein DENSPDRAFT_896397 [Dentipellis sp. KUC8613]
MYSAPLLGRVRRREAVQGVGTKTVWRGANMAWQGARRRDGVGCETTPWDAKTAGGAHRDRDRAGGARDGARDGGVGHEDHAVWLRWRSVAKQRQGMQMVVRGAKRAGWGVESTSRHATGRDTMRQWRGGVGQRGRQSHETQTQAYVRETAAHERKIAVRGRCGSETSASGVSRAVATARALDWIMWRQGGGERGAPACKRAVCACMCEIIVLARGRASGTGRGPVACGNGGTRAQDHDVVMGRGRARAAGVRRGAKTAEAACRRRGGARRPHGAQRTRGGALSAQYRGWVSHAGATQRERAGNGWRWAGWDDGSVRGRARDSVDGCKMGRHGRRERAMRARGTARRRRACVTGEAEGRERGSARDTTCGVARRHAGQSRGDKKRRPAPLLGQLVGVYSSKIALLLGGARRHGRGAKRRWGGVKGPHVAQIRRGQAAGGLPDLGRAGWRHSTQCIICMIAKDDAGAKRWRTLRTAACGLNVVVWRRETASRARKGRGGACRRRDSTRSGPMGQEEGAARREEGGVGLRARNTARRGRGMQARESDGASRRGDSTRGHKKARARGQVVDQAREKAWAGVMQQAGAGDDAGGSETALMSGRRHQWRARQRDGVGTAVGHQTVRWGMKRPHSVRKGCGGALRGTHAKRPRWREYGRTAHADGAAQRADGMGGHGVNRADSGHETASDGRQSSEREGVCACKPAGRRAERRRVMESDIGGWRVASWRGGQQRDKDASPGSRARAYPSFQFLSSLVGPMSAFAVY